MILTMLMIQHFAIMCCILFNPIPPAPLPQKGKGERCYSNKILIIRHKGLLARLPSLFGEGSGVGFLREGSGLG